MPESWIGDLNPEQVRAATAGEGPVLTIAGAGTGKTKTLASRVAWLVSQGIDPGRIMLLTFTRRASDEMLHRARRALGETGSRMLGTSGCRSRARLGRPHLFDRKGVADDVLGEPFHVLALAGEHPASAVDIEARVNPSSQHPGPLWEADHYCFVAIAFIAPTEQKLGKSNPPADRQSNPFHVIPDRERSP